MTQVDAAAEGAPVTPKEMIDLITLIGLGKANWIERAKAGKFKAAPEYILVNERRLVVLRAILVILQGKAKG